MNLIVLSLEVSYSRPLVASFNGPIRLFFVVSSLCECFSFSDCFLFFLFFFWKNVSRFSIDWALSFCWPFAVVLMELAVSAGRIRAARDVTASL